MLWMVTDENGRFQFDRLPAGKYALQGARRGFLNGTYEQHGQFSTAIVTGTDFDTTQLVLRLTPMASIEGKVIDESGDPVRNAQVRLYGENNEIGFQRIVPFNFGMTNDLGTFEFAPLPPGKYYVAVSARPWYAVHPHMTADERTSSPPPSVDRSLDVAYPTTYSGGATDSDGAAPIELKGGDHSEVEIHISPVPSLRIVFHVPNDDERRGFAPPIIEKRVFNGSEQNLSGPVRCASDMCEMTGVPAGTYIVRMPHPMSQETSLATSEIELRDDGQELDASKGEPEGSVNLTVQLPQQDPIPRNMAVLLTDRQTHKRRFQQVESNGQVTVGSLPAGKYSIMILSEGKPYSVVKISSEAEVSAGHEVNVTAGGTVTLTAVLAAGDANVEGFVKRNGKAASGIMVVLISRESSTREELFRRDQSDSDGSFRLPGVIPGQYSLVAIEDAWGFDWSKPAELARYAQRGQTITVPDGVHTTIHLPEPIEVQPR
jgi:hypothetical protein